MIMFFDIKGKNNVIMYKLCSIVIILGVFYGYFTLCNLGDTNNTNLPENIRNMSLLSCVFEVHGKVQGVFFRKHTEKFAKSIGVRGWCMNTSHGTVKGEIEATQKQLLEMKHWLEKVGSPSSRIEKVIYSDMKQIEAPQFTTFEIKKY